MLKHFVVDVYFIWFKQRTMQRFAYWACNSGERREILFEELDLKYKGSGCDDAEIPQEGNSPNA